MGKNTEETVVRTNESSSDRGNIIIMSSAGIGNRLAGLSWPQCSISPRSSGLTFGYCVHILYALNM